jgi:hypothetical protein
MGSVPHALLQLPILLLLLLLLLLHVTSCSLCFFAVGIIFLPRARLRSDKQLSCNRTYQSLVGR